MAQLLRIPGKSIENEDAAGSVVSQPRVMLGNKRKTGKEQFYTPLSTANKIVRNLLKGLPDLLFFPWIEPAGGTGSFVEAAKAAGVREVLSFDIEPQHPEVIVGDFLKTKLSEKNFVAVGNPPFGRNHALSIPFFNHSARFSQLICFIVPKSWRKWTVINRLDSNMRLIDDYDLRINYVDGNGELLSQSGTLNTIVQTWARSNIARGKICVEDRGVFKRCSPMEADVSLTIFGYSCGEVKTEFPRIPKTTQMFLKLCHPKALDALSSVDYSRFSSNVAYTEALSIHEINFLVNEFIFGESGYFEYGSPTSLL